MVEMLHLIEAGLFHNTKPVFCITFKYPPMYIILAYKYNVKMSIL